MHPFASVQTGAENPGSAQQVERSPTQAAQGHVAQAAAGAYSAHDPSTQSSRALH